MTKDNELFKTKQIGVQAIRSIFAFLGITCWLNAVKYIPLPEATALNLMVPIFSSIIAILFLKERLRLGRLIGIMVAMYGAYIIVNPDLNNFNIYYLLPLGSALMFSIYNNIVRFLTYKNHPITIMFYFFLFQTIICIPFMLQDFHMPSSKDLCILMLIASIALLNVYFHANAFKLSEITQVETFDFSRLIFACSLGFLLFGEVVEINTILGSLIILGISIVILKYEQLFPQKLWITNRGGRHFHFKSKAGH
jgi:drug/metabolite transporter (DMT)-like permease